jgi:PAS domain S-box-containing protein
MQRKQLRLADLSGHLDQLFLGQLKCRQRLPKQWLNFTGRTLEEELGTGWADGVHPEDYERYFETYNSAFDLRQPFRMEYRLRRSDGQFRWVYVTATARFSTGGKFLGYIGCCIDITERKEAEQALANLSGPTNPGAGR